MSPLSRIIAEEIRLKGPISFARFMELALYCPDYGYYEREPDRIGARGDFNTSVSVGPVFGELLATQFSVWIEELDVSAAGQLALIESGAHDGQLALDILNWMESRKPALLSKIRYRIVEPSDRRRKWQQVKLKHFANLVEWYPDFDHLKKSNAGCTHGIIFSNEMLDALPVRRFVWRSEPGCWQELLVDYKTGRFEWIESEGSNRHVESTIDEMVPEELRDSVPDGYLLEYGESAVDWWTEAASVLTHGWLLAFDYGYDADGLLSPEKQHGTLRSYVNHRIHTDVLSQPGERDITAHVRFDLVRNAGEKSGLQTVVCGEQSGFLVDIMRRLGERVLAAERWSPKKLRQFKTLVHPDHFGRSFKVIVQAKN